jgi:hypothetical protein
LAESQILQVRRVPVDRLADNRSVIGTDAEGNDRVAIAEDAVAYFVVELRDELMGKGET